MEISSKNEFHSLVSTLKSFLEEDHIRVKTSRIQEFFAKALGHNSANGLLSSLPKLVEITNEKGAQLSRLLQQKHNIEDFDGYSLLKRLEVAHFSYSSAWGSDDVCYPNCVPENENYWYLTKSGWLSWGQIDLNKMKAELNVYKVAYASSHGMGGSVSLVWDASIANYKFEYEANKLEKMYGNLPDAKFSFQKFPNG